MAVLSPTITSKRSLPCTWFSVFVVVPRRERRRPTPLPRRSSTSTRSTTRSTRTARSPVSDVNVLPPSAVLVCSWHGIMTVNTAVNAASPTSSRRKVKTNRFHHLLKL
ncbi:hypothetical protein K493DRAFT_320066 [Basidiobolus meristosporus CBS 931.73]|uniref:Uncharacterized protein n=1 Tax=Basidiobolus meristosporus CBS 931.73 TaxID=1314790 RepID=A0A1Y1XG98_9FUNG|nr:hypothetical protein K493DRAFT_320066 [Basidiobolus meristosporus CBS 931.73]|eukprot:ORX84789.1 hypothetical protein K493DRAFT_320066 [Basidiobolus meristosporus CBS 931.73]